jgi:hypothetical protein
MNRRQFLTAGAVATGGMILAGTGGAASLLKSDDLVTRAKTALDRHAAMIPNRDIVGIADFARNSATPRFHLVDLRNGRTQSFLVAHGRGSDPAHTGWLQRFSNLPGSEATSSGAFLTKDVYFGAHGRSRRLQGLDPDNNQAEARGIVMHGAWYVNPALAARGAIGRSQGCFAFSEDQVSQIIEQLGPGRLILATKV